jgi:hypothetical protein
LKSYVNVFFQVDRLDIQLLVDWTVPARHKPSIVKDFDRLGITGYSIDSTDHNW